MSNSSTLGWTLSQRDDGCSGIVDPPQLSAQARDSSPVLRKIS
jgi:hypothetical protein